MEFVSKNCAILILVKGQKGQQNEYNYIIKKLSEDIEIKNRLWNTARCIIEKRWKKNRKLKPQKKKNSRNQAIKQKPH